MTLTCAEMWNPIPHKWLIPDFICDSLTIISGEPKSGKSMLTGHLVASLIYGTEILNRTPEPGKYNVAWLGYDAGWDSELLSRFPQTNGQLFLENPIIYNDDQKWSQYRKELVESGINLLVIDHLYGLAEEVDLDESHEVDKVFRNLKPIYEELGIAVVLLAQAPKGGTGRAAHSQALDGKARHLVRITGSVRSHSRQLSLVGNNMASQTLKVKLTPEEILIQGTKNSIKSEHERDGTMIENCKRLLAEASTKALSSAKAAGRWLHEKEMCETPGAGRTRVNRMIEGGLLARVGDSNKLTSGPKLHT